MVGLKWKDVDLKSKTIQIRRSMEYRYSAKEWRIGEPKNKSGYRTILLTKEAVAILKKQKEKNKRISEISTEWEEFVFLCRKGTPVKNSTYDTALFKICDKAKIPRFSMHILRHTFATRCIEAGMKPKILQMLLGHSNIGITMNLYVHTTEEEKKKEWQKKNDMNIFKREVLGKVLLNSIPIFPVISFFTMLFTKDRLTLHDMIGKTIVVREK